MLMWMPVLSPVPDIAPPYPALGQVLYLFLQTVPASLVGALLSSTSHAPTTRPTCWRRASCRSVRSKTSSWAGC